MLIGITKFVCDECKTQFRGLAFEYSACMLIAPQRCIKCGSWHTLPSSCAPHPGELVSMYPIYQKIWEQHDKKK